MKSRLAALCVCLLLIGCSAGGGERVRPGARLLLIGIDGASWDEALPLVRQGEMPRLEALMRRGFSARLSTMAPALSPVIWTTIATGKKPEKHGIRGFVVPDGSGGEVPVTSNLRRTSALWGQLGDAGARVAVVGWWATWPAEEVKGWMVSPLAVPGQRTWKGSVYARRGAEQTWPDDLIEELAPDIEAGERAAAEEFPRLMRLPETGAMPRYLEAFVQDTRWVHVSDTLFRDIGVKLLEKKNPDFAAVYLGCVDVIGHRFWRFAHPETGGWESTVAEREAFGPALRRVYAWADAAIGRLVDAAGPEATILVISDHGMEAAERDARRPATPWNLFPQEISGGHTRGPSGLLVFAGPGSAVNFDAGWLAAGGAPPELGTRAHPAVLDIAPTLLHFFGLPVGRDMDGAPLQGILGPPVLGRPVRFIDTWDDPSRLPDPTPRESPRMEEIKRRLEGLGYIGN